MCECDCADRFARTQDQLVEANAKLLAEVAALHEAVTMAMPDRAEVAMHVLKVTSAIGAVRRVLLRLEAV